MIMQLEFVKILDKIYDYLVKAPSTFSTYTHFGYEIAAHFEKKKIIRLYARYNSFVNNHPEFGCITVPPFFRRSDMVFCIVDASLSTDQYISEIAKMRLVHLMAYSEDCLVRERIESIMINEGIKNPLRYAISLLDPEREFDNRASKRRTNLKVFT